MRLFLSLTLVTACAYGERARVISPADVNTPYAAITNYLSTKGANSVHEAPPGNLSAATLEDAATLTRADAAGTCITIVEHTESALDKPLSDWNFKLDDQTTYPRDEKVNVAEYPYTTDEGNDASFKVYERTGQLCGGPAHGPILLSVELPSNGVNYGQLFQWQVTAVQASR
jgi:hypothetical protein